MNVEGGKTCVKQQRKRVDVQPIIWQQFTLTLNACNWMIGIFQRQWRVLAVAAFLQLK